jgi:hypothetical protein
MNNIRITMHSHLWPEISATIWNVGKAWFCKCQSINAPQFAKTENFPTRAAAFNHAKIVLGR